MGPRLRVAKNAAYDDRMNAIGYPADPSLPCGGSVPGAGG